MHTHTHLSNLRHYSLKPFEEAWPKIKIKHSIRRRWAFQYIHKRYLSDEFLPSPMKRHSSMPISPEPNWHNSVSLQTLPVQADAVICCYISSSHTQGIIYRLFTSILSPALLDDYLSTTVDKLYLGCKSWHILNQLFLFNILAKRSATKKSNLDLRIPSQQHW